MQQAASPLRERKRLATRTALEEAALRLFAAKGYASTTIDEISAQAKVSRSTFFRYFGSKESVLFATDDERVDHFVDIIRVRPAAEGPLEAFESALQVLAAEPPDHVTRDLLQTKSKLLSTDPALRTRRSERLSRMTDRFAQALAERDGDTAPGPGHRVASWVGMAVVQEMSQEWLEAPREPDPVSLVRQRFELLRSLVAPGA